MRSQWCTTLPLPTPRHTGRHKGNIMHLTSGFHTWSGKLNDERPTHVITATSMEKTDAFELRRRLAVYSMWVDNMTVCRRRRRTPYYLQCLLIDTNGGGRGVGQWWNSAESIHVASIHEGRTHGMSAFQAHKETEFIRRTASYFRNQSAP